MNMEKENLPKRLIDKSIEAFIMGIEIYNKPTIKYRAEGFSFFICNAWELLIKAYLIDNHGEQSVYFNDNPNRTISLSDAIKLVFTNKHDPLRLNLEQIIQLRNTSTHFITDDYEKIYAPLFQASVINYDTKLKEFYDIDITDFIASNFLTLSLNIEDRSDDEIRAKYSKVMAERLIKEKKKINNEIQTEGPSFSIPVQTKLIITKNPKDADLSVNISSTSDNNVTLIHDVKDPNNIYIYTQNKVISLVNKRLKKKSIVLNKQKKSGEKYTDKFTSRDFQLFVKFYDLKHNSKYCYHYEIGNRFGYSIKVVELITREIIKNPSIIPHIKEELLKAKK